MSLACGHALYSPWNHKITLNSLDCVGKSWRALDMTSESECEINPKQLNASLKCVYPGVHSGPTAAFFFSTIFFKGLFLFFWDRVSRLVLNSRYLWLSLLSAGITPCLASERALLPEGTPPFVEWAGPAHRAAHTKCPQICNAPSLLLRTLYGSLSQLFP